jgi:pimeloyl-ACP methyl ester carboxylesterase
MATIFSLIAWRVRLTVKAGGTMETTAAAIDDEQSVAHQAGGGWTRRRVLRGLATMLVIGIAPSAWCASIASGSSVFTNGIRQQDEIILVDVRSLCGSCRPEALIRGLRYEAYAVCDEAGYRSWQPSDFDRFLAFDPSVKTVVFIHGNQVTPWDARSQGLAVYRRLMHYGDSDEPIRFVIFSWPSEKVGGLLRDVRLKASRTGPAGCQLAWLLDQLPSETPVSLIGFSFGARIATGALHILGGGTLSGYALTERVHPDRSPLNAVLMCAALDAHWFGDGQYHGLAMTQVDRMLLINNCADRAMRFYRFIDRSRPLAMGCWGPTCIGPEYASKISMRDFSRQMGPRHDLNRYLAVPSAMAMMWDHTNVPRISSPVLASN